MNIGDFWSTELIPECVRHGLCTHTSHWHTEILFSLVFKLASSLNVSEHNPGISQEVNTVSSDYYLESNKWGHASNFIHEVRLVSWREKTKKEKKVGEEKAYTSLSEGRGQEPGGRSWCRGHRGVLLTGLLPMTCSTCFLSFLIPGMSPPTMGWTLFHQSLIKMMPCSWIL